MSEHERLLAPIFLFSSGWNSGNFEIQQFLKQSVFFWGEPFSATRWLRRFGEWNSEGDDAHRLDQAMGEFTRHLLEKPIRREGVTQWGMADVRCDASAAKFLQRSYPESTIIFVHRNPYDAFSEYLSLGQIWQVETGTNLTATSFSRHWAAVTESFLNASDLKNFFVVDRDELLQSNGKGLLEFLVRRGYEIGANQFEAAVKQQALPRLPQQLRAEIEKQAAATGERLVYAGQTRCAGTSGQSGLQDQVPARDRRPKVVLIIRGHGAIDPLCERALRELESKGAVIRRQTAFSANDVGKSLNASHEMANGCDCIFWIDGHIVFSPDDIQRMLDYDLPFVAGLTTDRSGEAFDCTFLEETKSVRLGVGPPIPVEYTGMGFAMTRREVFEKVAALDELPLCNQSMNQGRGFTPYFLPRMVRTENGLRYLHDEYAFQSRCKESGFEIHVAPEIRLGTVGRRVVSWEEVVSPRQRFEQMEVHVGARDNESSLAISQD